MTLDQQNCKLYKCMFYGPPNFIHNSQLSIVTSADVSLYEVFGSIGAICIDDIRRKEATSISVDQEILTGELAITSQKKLYFIQLDPKHHCFEVLTQSVEVLYI